MNIGFRLSFAAMTVDQNRFFSAATVEGKLRLPFVQFEPVNYIANTSTPTPV
jgi:hypothetical protein